MLTFRFRNNIMRLLIFTYKKSLLVFENEWYPVIILCILFYPNSFDKKFHKRI